MVKAIYHKISLVYMAIIKFKNILLCFGLHAVHIIAINFKFPFFSNKNLKFHCILLWSIMDTFKERDAHAQLVGFFFWVIRYYLEVIKNLNTSMC